MYTVNVCENRKTERLVVKLVITHPIPPRGTPCDAEGLLLSLVKGSIGAFCQFVSCQAKSEPSEQKNN